MTRKTNNKNTKPQDSGDKVDVNKDVESLKDTLPAHKIVQEGKALKLSPKSTNHVFYEIGRDPVDDELHVRLVGNEGGGLHSKEWIKLSDVLEVLSEQQDKPFKSSLLKPLFKGGSANNSAFLAACIRRMGLTIQAETSVFLHVVAPDFDKYRDELLALQEQNSNAE
ncbi:hypothetical protein JCM19238_3474 [Vibrio ponticus]|nr:hypothetical protein JCM19238_3474 [Vibrio ponticus]